MKILCPHCYEKFDYETFEAFASAGLRFYFRCKKCGRPISGVKKNE